MKSRVHPKYQTKYRVGNWRAYERALVQRGDVTLWLSADATDAWRPAPSGRPGGQPRFSDLAIETALTRRLVFRWPWRQTEGFLRSILALLRTELDTPDHTTLARRSQRLDVKLYGIPAEGPIHLIVDSTGLSIVGEGAWAAVQHGGRGTRGGKKLHLGVDRSGVLIAQALTDATAADATTGTSLVEQMDRELSSVTADTAYDTIAFYDEAGARGATVVVPPARTASVSRRGPPVACSRSHDQEGEGASDADDGRRPRGTIGKRAWRMHSSDTNRSSEVACEPEREAGGRPTHCSRATS